ncbi:hypothetical protein IQ255_18735 [Pleurocapsales cyanobacterium LEGE 10410]|nr:hypothetical protein [Pleurocapsales cyanobacterium LEGE 10410]
MGGHPYWYWTKYQTDVKTTLEDLRQREFMAGRYNPVMPFIEFPITDDSSSPGANHGSIDEALEASEADGTRSILDISEVSNLPYEEALDRSTQGEVDLYCTTFPFSKAELIDLFGTDRPDRQMVESAINELCENLDRGIAKHIIIYDRDRPIEVFFIGCSFD